ncbi:uncharacterized protein LOC132733495 [Ruditapes philippinarum]|uniref:uncharacterized protein LOC132733495 n=1 Tax=Ruditapes philippinarum TaxID=129788 RepID=UPI00295ABEDA|nr:uncharacterized protein LOC132733495 [Ruditapes philippinarum]
MISLLDVGFIFAYVALFFGNEMDNSRSQNTSAALYFSIAIIVIFCIFIGRSLGKNKKSKGNVYTLIEKSIKKLNMELWLRINKETIRADKYFVCFRDGYLDIVRFDPKPCQGVFERRCRNLKSLTKLVTPGEGETDIEYTERLFESYLKQNYTRLTVPSNVYGAHEMKNGASCLCTLLENDILKEDQYQLT